MDPSMSEFNRKEADGRDLPKFNVLSKDTHMLTHMHTRTYTHVHTHPATCKGLFHLKVMITILGLA